MLAEGAITTRGQFAVALAGGSTPRPVYERLAAKELAARVDWSRVQVFWGDERCVSPEHPESNYRMARETLLDRVPIPLNNVHRIKGEMEPRQAAEEYERTLRAFFASGTGGSEPTVRLDLVVLGMGEDAHTASLFPHTAVLHECTRWVVAHYIEKLGGWRITLTPVAINAARNVTFIVSGSGKAETLRRVLTEPYQPEVLPAQMIRPTDGHLLWLIDSAAATLLGEAVAQNSGESP